MAAELRFGILGPLEVRRNGAAVDLGARRQRALLTRLLVDAGQVVSTDRLIDALWGESPPDSAPAQLQTYVSRLRRVLDPAREPGQASLIESEASGYVLRADRTQLDAARFEELADAGHAALAEGRHEAALETLSEALELWRGDALGEFALEPFADPVASRLEGLRLSTTEDRIDAALALGRHASLAATLEGLVAAHPLRERFRGQLALALYRSGRQAEALATLREGRELMREELGITPSPRLRKLETQILRQDSELDWQPPPAEAEREPDTVVGTYVFTDIEGSTRLLQRLGTDAYSEAITTHDHVLRGTFARYGGREEDSQGDSFFFVFGDPCEAVRATVEAQRTLRAQHWPAGAQLSVRMGLHTGEASVVEGKLLGLAVHRAARVAEAAHGGQILVSEATAKLVEREDVRLRSLGEHRLKDLERPLELIQLVADGLETEFPALRSLSAGVSFATTGRAAGGLTFTGRDREYGVLTEALHDVLTGAGRLALIEGEAGIGKSRLALELAHRAAEQGVALLWGTCVESGAAPTLWPWVEVVRGLAETLDQPAREAWPAEVAALLPGAAPQEAPAPGDVQQRFRLYAATVDVLMEAASRRPLLVVLDDVHWADAPTLELLESMALKLVSSPLLLVVTLRENEPGAAEALTPLLATIARYPWTRRLVLRGLPHDAVRDLIRETAEVEPPPSLVDVVHTRTDGNPFFVAELVQLLAAESDLETERVLYTGIPLGVRDVVRRRLQTLPAGTLEVLELGAVIGSELEFQLLAAAAGQSPAECADHLDPALRTRIVLETEHGSFRFSHGLVRETLLGDLTPLRRARLHLRVAEAMVETGADQDAAEVLAGHFWQARELADPVAALPAHERAAAAALARHAYSAAGDLLERAIELSRRFPAGKRDDAELRAELELASLRMMTQGYTAPAVVAGFERAGAIARRSGNLVELVKSLHGTASALAVGGHFAESLEVGRQCLEAAEELATPLPLAVGHLCVGTGHMHLGQITDARRSFDALLEALERLPHERGHMFDLALPISLSGPVFAGIVAFLGGDAGKARALRRRAIATANELATPLAQQVAMFFGGWLSALEDDPASARDFIERGHAAAGSHFFPVFASLSQPLAAWAAGREGDAAAPRRLEGMLTGLESMGIRTNAHFYYGLLADLLTRDDPAAGVAAFERAIVVSGGSGERFYLAELLRRRGELLVQVGNATEGRATLDQALSLAKAQGAAVFEQRVESTLAGL